MVLGSLLPNHTVHAYFLGGSSAIRGSGRSFFGSLPCELALATAPDIVLIMLGTNDSKAKVWNLAVYERDLQALALAFAAPPLQHKQSHHPRGATVLLLTLGPQKKLRLGGGFIFSRERFANLR